MEVRVTKARLLETLVANREDHISQYEVAKEKYKAQAIAWYEAAIADALDDKPIQTHLRLPIPEEHTDDFDRAILMMSWHQEESVLLDEDQFEQYVNNRWGWHRSFMANTSSYLGSS